MVPKISITGAGGGAGGEAGGSVMQGLLAMLMADRLNADSDGPTPRA